MPFREKMRKAFGRSPSSSQTSSPGALTPVTSLSQLAQRDKKSKKKDKSEGGDVYKPGEAMPKLKYRAPVDPQHKDRLEAFSFSSAWDAMRRKSTQSQYSPMGSRMPSRMGSLVSNKVGRSSRQQSFAVPIGLEESKDADDDLGNGKSCIALREMLNQVMGLNLGAVGLSRHQTKEETVEATGEGEELDKMKTITLGDGLHASKTITNGNELEASKTITNGHVNGVRDERLQVDGHVHGTAAMSNDHH
ncbi:hypothetical protein MMC26_004585 [Xylographa opegraphella]|nr:hypothetical protein [Xylographa opegraphella]